MRSTTTLGGFTAAVPRLALAGLLLGQLAGCPDLRLDAGTDPQTDNQTDGELAAIDALTAAEVKAALVEDASKAFYLYSPEQLAGFSVFLADVNGDGIADAVLSPAVGAAPAATDVELRRRPGIFPPVDEASAFEDALEPAGQPVTDGQPTTAGQPVDPDTPDSSPPFKGPDRPLQPAKVRIIDGATRQTLLSFSAFEHGFLGGVSVAVGDVTGDGKPDLVVGAGPEASPLVRIFALPDGEPLREFLALEADFSGGVRVAVGDLDGDGVAEIVTAAGPGSGPHVRVFDGRSGQELAAFLAFGPDEHGGVNIAVGDIDGDGRAEVLAAAGPGGGPHVRVFDLTGQLIRDIFAFDETFTGGVLVAAADVNGDGRDDAVLATASGGQTFIQVLDAQTAAILSAARPADTQGAADVRIVPIPRGLGEFARERRPGDLAGGILGG